MHVPSTDVAAYGALLAPEVIVMSETKSTVLVKHHLKALKLPTMGRECEKVATRAAVENLDHLAYLLQLCELELIERERRAAERRLKAAKFPATKTLDEFDFRQQPSVNKPLVLELAKGQYLDAAENVLLIGASGVGKTHLAIALGLAACAQGRKVRFFRVTELITLLLEAREEKTTHAAAEATGATRSVDPRRTGLRADRQGRRGTVVRRPQHGLRTGQSDRHDELAVRALDRGAR